MVQPLTGKRILIVEDDAVFRCVLAGFLNAEGVEVSEAINGIDALSKQAEIRPDAILCDLLMPEMGGIEFVQRLRAGGRQTPVVVISATERMADVASVLRFGVQDVLLKPLQDLNLVRDALLACFYPDMFTSPALAGEALAHDWAALSHNPAYAEQLLKQLQPPVQQTIAGCKVNYRQLTAYDKPGLVLDIAGLSPDDLAFYCLDITRSPQSGVLAALTIRSLFNELLQEQLAHHEQRLPQMSALLKQVNHMLRQAGLSGQFPLLAGYYHAGLQNLILVSAGLHARIEAGEHVIQLNGGVPLGTMGSVQINQVSQRCAVWQCQVRGGGGQLRLMLANQLVAQGHSV